MSTIGIGDRVRIERDETGYPPRGTWREYRGRIGTVVEINDAGRGPAEHAVVFGAVHQHSVNGSLYGSGGSVAKTWFLPHELAAAGVRREDRVRNGEQLAAVGQGAVPGGLAQAK